MKAETEVTGVILAGGLARRMNHLDKGLLQYQGRPMVSYAIDALSKVAGRTLINANRNLEQYRRFGLPVITDQNGNFEGPLAGILSAMIYAGSGILLVTPCDSPLISSEHLQTLLSVREAHAADAAVAFDGERLHPVFLSIRISLMPSLQDYLARGQRKIDRWLEQLHTVRADFSASPEIFTNINTPADLAGLESKGSGSAI
ncbi:MAG: molybdenum cofactor guanylyltransferase MobA [Gammaproteobacteria bacterium]